MRWIVAVLIVPLLAGCASTPAETPVEDEFSGIDADVDTDTGLIRGVVVDQTISPVPGVTVALNGDSQETDDEGRFLFSDLAPGAYFLEASKSLYETVQFSANVEAGVAEPPIVRVQMQQLFTSAPSMIPIKQDGFFTCSQNGASVFYSSSPCSSVTPLTNDITDPLTPQEREWHADVPGDWVTQVFEMAWTPSAAATGQHMGLVVSTYKPERDGLHWFLNHQSGMPWRAQLNVGEIHETAGSPEPRAVPAEGMADMSFFASVRRDTAAPAVAIQQSFEVYVHQFINCVPPEGWSVYNGDENPC